MASVLSVHLDCHPKSATCAEYRFLTNSAQTTLATKKEAFVFSEKNVLEAAVTKDQFLRDVLSINLNSEGAKAYAELTKKNIGKPIVILLDDKVVMEPVVQSEIKEGRLQMTFGAGSFKPENRDELISRLPWLKKSAAQR